MTKKNETVDPILRDNFLRLEQVAKREEMCVHVPALELEVPVKLIIDSLVFTPFAARGLIGTRRAIIYTDKLEDRFTTMNFDQVMDLFSMDPGGNPFLLPAHVFAAGEIYKHCYPVFIEFRPDKELEKEKV